jgi:hypothetical protein
MAALAASHANPVGLALAGVFVVLVMTGLVRQKLQAKHRDQVARGYAERLAPAVVGAHTWQPASTDGLRISYGPEHSGELFGKVHWAVHEDGDRENAVPTACTTNLDGLSVLAFDNVQTIYAKNRNVIERTTCVRFASPIPLPTIVARSGRGSVTLMKPLPWQFVVPELDDFNECYTVRATDVKAAFAFFEPEMMTWLIAQTQLCELSIEGTDVFAALETDPKTTFDPDAALPFVDGFLAQIKKLSLI